MRQDDEDEQDRQRIDTIEAWRSQLNAPQAHLWLHRGTALGGVIARLWRRLAKRRAARGAMPTATARSEAEIEFRR